MEIPYVEESNLADFQKKSRKRPDRKDRGGVG